MNGNQQKARFVTFAALAAVLASSSAKAEQPELSKTDKAILSVSAAAALPLGLSYYSDKVKAGQLDKNGKWYMEKQSALHKEAVKRTEKPGDRSVLVSEPKGGGGINKLEMEQAIEELKKLSPFEKRTLTFEYKSSTGINKQFSFGNSRQLISELRWRIKNNYYGYTLTRISQEAQPHPRIAAWVRNSTEGQEFQETYDRLGKQAGKYSKKSYELEAKATLKKRALMGIPVIAGAVMLGEHALMANSLPVTDKSGKASSEQGNANSQAPKDTTAASAAAY